MKKLHIVHLYPNEMNTYGDRGNILTLTRRAQWHGLEPVIHHHHPGKPFPSEAHIIFGGGGQDSAQSDIQIDILRIGDRLHQLAKTGVPMLTICGTYQLFGHRFVTHDKQSITGIGLFDLETQATSQRLIGNLAAETKEFGILYGFENHSGQTYLNKNQAPLGKVIRGHGNNADSGLEGARSNNALGCYLHGPVLPANPMLSDWLIATGATLAHGNFTPRTIDDKYALMARSIAKNRKY
jgi:lipid II isoglutaminyl synthase (glutamine-hydrolysing)